MTAVFVDTSALLSIMDKDDEDHDRVVAALRKLLADGTKLVTTSYVLVECGALVLRRLGIEAFRALGVASREAFDVFWVDEPLHLEAWERVSEGGRRGPGLVDWTSFLAMREMEIDTALSLDHHFSARGFTTLP